MPRKPRRNKVETFPMPASAKASDVYTVTAGGAAVPVERFEDIHFAHFAFDGEAEVAVSIPPSIGHRNLHFVSTYEIAPRRYGIKATASVNTLTFRLDRPRKLVIEINKHERLFLFADSIEKNAPKPGDKGVVNAADFVKDATGKTLQTKAIAAAIKAVPKNGTLYFPAGVYLTGTVVLKSDMTMYLAGGAVLKGSPEIDDYPPDEKSSHWANQQFVAVPRARNVKITGYGRLDANGTDLSARQHGPHLLTITDSRDVTVEGIFVIDPAAWNTHPINSDNVTLRNIKMLNNRNVLNTDGFDITSCRNVLLEDSFAYTSDDGVVLKSHAGFKGRDIMVRRNVVVSKKSALKVGTETEGDITNVTFADNDVVECDRGMSLYVEDGATVKNVTYVGNRFERFIPDARRRVLDFYIWNRKGGGNLVNVLIKDCEVDTKWPRPSTVMGLDAKNAIRGLRFENYRIEGKVATSVEEADILVDVLSVLRREVSGGL